VQILEADFRAVPPQVQGHLNWYVLTSPSLQQLEFGTANGSRSLELVGNHDPLPFVNLLLSAVGGSAPIATLVDVPLCQTTALAFANTLMINKDKLQNVSIDFPLEEEEDDDDDDVETLVRQSLAPAIAQALKRSNLESLGLNWMEHDRFSTGEAFFPALPGFLPSSLRLLEFSNFVDSDVIAPAIAAMIRQSEGNMDSILFSFCKFQDDNFRRILVALQQENLKVLHYGYLHTGTAPAFAQSIATFGCLNELGVGFHEDVQAFELFCEELAPTATLKTLDVQLFKLHDAPTLKRFLQALAVALPKLPNLRSITTVYTYGAPSVLETVPGEFLTALEAHQHLTDWTPRIRLANNQQLLMEYYLLRNRFRDQLTASKPVMLEAFRALNRDNGKSNPALSCTLVKDTLISRNDWFRIGFDDGRPLPPPAEKAPVVRRYQKGLLF